MRTLKELMPLVIDGRDGELTKEEMELVEAELERGREMIFSNDKFLESLKGLK